MNPFTTIHDAVVAAVARLIARGELPASCADVVFTIEPPRDPAHGDMATNAAMILAKPAGRKPLDVAVLIAAELAGQGPVTRAEAAPPGFVNLHLEVSFWQAQVGVVLAAGIAYGRSELGAGEAINVEFCSANPTGPLHVGHGRGTVFGDALASLLAHAGYAVTREYYVNDGGGQIDAVARSVHWRYREALGVVAGAVPEGLYPGDYLVPLAGVIAKRDGAKWTEMPEENWIEAFRAEAVGAMMVLIREDLESLGVRHDVFTSEKALIDGGKIDEALDFLDGRGLLYTGTLPPPKGKAPDDWEPTPQLLFRATGFGDDIDRPLKRSNGAWTYFAADVAYHRDKYRRGFARMVDVWGADHGGYVKRMQAAVRAVSEERSSLEVRLCQLVNLLDDGKPLRMSKRAGRIVTLRDVVDEVGKDVVRFIMLTRKNDAPLDFDLKKVTEQSKDNPVFYVQYAHARISSVFRNVTEDAAPSMAHDLGAASLDRLTDPAELTLIRQMASFPRTIEAAAKHAEPHRIAFFLYDLASAFHALWTRGKEDASLRFILADDPELTRARLAMLEAVRLVLATGLGLLGVRPLAELH